MIKANETQENYIFSDDNWIALSMIKENSKVLSCGCGNGREVSFLVKEKHCKVTAIDIQPDYIIESMNKEPNANYVCGSILDHDIIEKYDYIVCLWNTINYLTKNERKKFIKNCCNYLNDGGYLIVVSADIFKSWRYIFHNLKYKTNYYYHISEIDHWFENTCFNYRVNRLNKTNLIISKKK